MDRRGKPLQKLEHGNRMRRESMLARMREREKSWDMIVIGGGATGAGVALDAASRGYSVLLLEREDFGKGTSSRSTKLIHGGVRYLQQGNLSLVIEALRERDTLLRNAPHLVHELPFIVPGYSWWEKPFYGLGLKVYDLLAGGRGLGRSKVLSASQTAERLPAIRREGLRGGVLYHDGQFDDARLLMALILTAVEQGAVVLNYAGAVDLTKDANGVVNGVAAVDRESGERFSLRSKVVINATGIFSDEVRRLADPAAAAMIRPSQGIHLVFDGSFLSGDTAMLVPHTRDGRLLFAIPWLNHTLVGTTDTPIPFPSDEPVPLEQEIQLILETAARYFEKAPARADVLSVFAGIRPLLKSARRGGPKTSTLSRRHAIRVDSDLVTVTGGKWTTYRRMAQDAVDRAISLGKLGPRPCATRDLRLHGWQSAGPEPLSTYGSDAVYIKQIAAGSPDLTRQLDPQLPYTGAEVVWAAREEMARTLEDVLARRLRALPINARAAMRMAPAAAQLLARELGKDESWAQAQVRSFCVLAAQYHL